MFSFNDKISIRQLQILLVLNIFGTGVILLPRIASEYANQDGWILVLISTLLAIICVYIITTLTTMFNDLSFYEYSSLIISKPIAFILSIGFVIRLIIHMALELRIFGEIVKQTMLYNTPFFIISILLLLVSAYVSSKGYETRARLGEMLIYIVFIPIIIVFSLSIFRVDFSNVLPVMRTNPQIMLRGSIFTLYAFIGIELLLLVGPFVSKTKNIKKGAIQAVLLVGLFMSIITLITIARFGVLDVKNQIWPIIKIMDSTEIPGSFLQRQGALVMSFFIISVFAILNAFLFFSSTILKSVFKRGSHTYYITICVIITFSLSMLPINIVKVYELFDLVFITFGIAYMFIIPIILLILAKIRKLGDKQ